MSNLSTALHLTKLLVRCCAVGTMLLHFFLTALALVIDDKVFWMHADIMLMWVGRMGRRPLREWCEEEMDKSVWCLSYESNSRPTLPSCADRESHQSCTYRNSCNIPSQNIISPTPDLRHEQAHLRWHHFSKVFCSAVSGFEELWQRFFFGWRWSSAVPLRLDELDVSVVSVVWGGVAWD